MATKTKTKTSSAAKTLGQQLAKDINARGYSYDRELCKRFQRAAGLTADGLYGPATRQALVDNGVSAPSHLFAGAGMAKAGWWPWDDDEKTKKENQESFSGWWLLGGLLIGGYLISRSK